MPLTHAEDGSETKLPTPIKVDMLEYFLYGYDPHLRQKLVQGFTFGFKINSTICRESRNVSKNHRSAMENTQVVAEKIQKEILKCRFRGPFLRPPFDNFICSPLGLIPKKEKVLFG